MKITAFLVRRRFVLIAAVALATSLAPPLAASALAEIISIEQLTPWTTRYLVRGSSSVIQHPGTLRIANGNKVTVTATLLAQTPLEPLAPPSVTIRDGCVVIPHPFTPFQPCTDPVPYPSPEGLALTNLGAPVVVTNPHIPKTFDFDAFGPGQISFAVSPGDTAELVVTIDPPRPSFFTRKTKEMLSSVADDMAIWGMTGAASALMCKAIPSLPPLPGNPPNLIRSVCLGVTATTAAVGGLASSALKRLATDPLDPNYATVVAPTLPIPTEMATGNAPLDAIVNRFTLNGAELVGYADAALVSINRFSGAVAAGDAAAEALQAAAVAQFLHELQTRVAAYPALLGGVGDALATAGMSSFSLTPEILRDAQQEVFLHGLLPEIAHEMTRLGALPSAIEENRLALITRDPHRLARTFPDEWIRDDESADVLALALLLPTAPIAPMRTICGARMESNEVIFPFPCPHLPFFGPTAAVPEKTWIFFGAGGELTSSRHQYCGMIDLDGNGTMDAICDYYPFWSR